MGIGDHVVTLDTGETVPFDRLLLATGAQPRRLKLPGGDADGIHSLRTLDDIQRVVPEPILCTTPLLRKLKQRQRGLRRHWVPASVAGVLILTAAFFFVRLTVFDHIGVGQPTQAIAPTDSTVSQANR